MKLNPETIDWPESFETQEDYDHATEAVTDYLLRASNAVRYNIGKLQRYLAKCDKTEKSPDEDHVRMLNEKIVEAASSVKHPNFDKLVELEKRLENQSNTMDVPDPTIRQETHSSD